MSANFVSAPRHPARRLDRRAQRLSELLDIRVRQDERREDPDHCHVVAGDLGEDVVLPEERHHHELREQSALSAFDHAVRHSAALRLAELDRPREPEPAHVPHHLEFLHERPCQGEELIAQPRALLHEAPLAELVQRREPGRHRELVRRERRAVRHRVGHRVEDGFVHRARHEERAHRDIAARQRLRHRHQVRLEPPVLEGEHPARPPEARHHLVDTEQRPVAAAQRLRALEVAVGRQVNPLALHRLDEEERHVLAPQLLLERLEVAERHLLEAREERLKPRGELRVPVRRERAEREAVEAVLRGEDALALRRRASELERGLDRLGAAAREQAALDPAAGERDQLLRE